MMNSLIVSALAAAAFAQMKTDMITSIKDQTMADMDPMLMGRNMPQFDCNLCEMYNTTEGGLAWMVWSKD